MANEKEYVVTSGIVTLGADSFHQHETVSLTDEQAERLKDFVTAKKVVEVQKSADVDFSTMTVDELKALSDAQGLVIEGSGANGKIVKADYVSALEAAK